jgi:putative ABC transport system permease protein
MSNLPPKWIDRLLAWYCNPDLLEEIQGDAYELYEQRLKRNGNVLATMLYLWDVIRFFRWSNMRRADNDYRAGFLEVLVNLNFKLAFRQARRNKIAFAVKTGGLAVCVAFTIVVTAFVINERTYEHDFHGYQNIYRIGSRVESNGAVSNYAVSPLPLATALRDELPEVIRAARIMGTAKPKFITRDVSFQNISTFTADSSFLRMFRFKFLSGDVSALDEPDKVVFTRTEAMRIFGTFDVSGQMVSFHETELEVSAVVEDPPARTHLQFGALISWDTYNRNDVWDNVNAYTYVQVAPGTSRTQFSESVNLIEQEYLELITQEFQLKFESSVLPIDEIHLSPPMDEDFAARANVNNLYILETVIVLFLITGLINYLNISQAEVAASTKKHSLLSVFGGIDASKAKAGLADVFVCMIVGVPLCGVLAYFFITLAHQYLGVNLDPSVWSHPLILAGLPIALMTWVVVAAKVNSSSHSVAQSLRGEVIAPKGSFSLRSAFVAGQLIFSVFVLAVMVIILDQFRFIDTADKGFTSKNTIVITMPGFDAAQSEAFIEATREIAGVALADACSYIPGGGIETKEFFEVDTEAGMRRALINYIHTGYDYLDLLNIRLKEGRNFDSQRPADVMGSYLVNEAAAKHFGWKNPIGTKINGPLEADGRTGEVIGVLADFHYASVHNKIEPLIIFLNHNWDINFVYIKLSPAQAADVLHRIDRAFARVFPGTAMDWSYLDDRYQHLYRDDNRIKNVVAGGLIISLLISALGIYSMSALLLARRTREMGIRKVVGASHVQLFLLHIKTFVVLLAAAIAIAGPMSYFAGSHWLTTFAYHIDISAWHVLIPLCISIAMILLATGTHGVRAAMIKPTDVLKSE